MTAYPLENQFVDIFVNIFAGLGLFFIGIRLISQNLTNLAGLRMRQLMTRALSGHGSALLFGLVSGAVMQSLNAVTHLLVAMVTAGTIDNKRAFPVVNWANIGTSMLVIVATMNFHMPLFERCVWLLRRYILLLADNDKAESSHAPVTLLN